MSANTKPAKRPRYEAAIPTSSSPLASWEDAETHSARLAALMIEHAPQGPTETHLVEQLAHLMLRRDRLARAEQGLLAAGLQRTTEHSWSRQEIVDRVKLIPGGEHADQGDIPEALTSDETTDREFIGDAQACLDSLHAARKQLQSGDGNAYKAALMQLHPDMHEAWENAVSQADNEDDPEWRPSASDLERYIDTDLAPWMTTCVESRHAYPIIRAQARAQAYEPEKMATLYDLDARLTRQFEKTLAMLIRLQEIRLAEADHKRKSAK